MRKCSTVIIAEKYPDSVMMTLKKISRLSGFSTSTVSKALNDCYDVSIDTKKLIQDIAFRYNYTPNRNAVALRKNKTNIIAVILPWVNQELYSDLLSDIQQRASESEYRIMLYQSFEKESKEKEFLEDISDGSVDAAIILSTHEEIRVERRIPMVYLQIFKKQSLQDLLEQCRFDLENLLEEIK